MSEDMMKIESAKGLIKPFTRSSRDPLLEERETTHGSFEANAAISQNLKVLWRGKNDIPFVQQEALDMIALKISRIVSGKADVRDHWDDIAGYAKLAAEVCRK